MAAGGLNGQLMLKAEATYGTAVTPDRSYELRDEGESIDAAYGRVESDAQRAGQRHMRSEDWTTGTTRVAGDFNIDLSTKNMALLFRHLLGAVSTTGPSSGQYTHAISAGDKTGLGLTIQAGRPSSDGTVQPYTWAGCKLRRGELSFEVDKIVPVKFGVLGKSQTTATALATASYTASNQLLSYTHGAITVGGSAIKVKSGTWTYTTPLKDDRFFLGDVTVNEPLENGRHESTFELNCEFESLTAYNRIVNGTEAALSLAFTRSTDSVTIAGNVRFDSGTPHLAGKDLLEVTLSGKFIATGADSTAVTVTVVSSEATP